MSTYNRLSYLASKGDMAINNQKTTGDPIFTGDSKYPFDVLGGEIVIFDAKANEALEHTDIASAQHVSVAIGVGPKGQLAPTIRYLGGESFDLCEFTMKATVAPPTCGFPQILNVFYNGTTCEDAATIMFLLDDHIVRDRYNYNELAKYIFTANPPCTNCDTCTAEDNGDAITDEFVNQINATRQDNPFALSHFQNRDIGNQYQPFRALKLYNQVDSLKTFCLSLQDETCVDCAYVEGITGITIDTVSSNFTYTTEPGDTTKTLKSQMDRVVYEINTALGDTGEAYLTKGIGGCCPYSITVSTTATAITLNTDGGAIQPCEEVNPFDATTYTNGFTILVDPVTVECLCDLPPDDVPNYYGRSLKAEFMGDGWGCNQTQVVEKQAQVLPEGFGYFWQDKERYQHNGGSGKDFRNSDRYQGKTYYRPDKYSRTMAAAATVDCGTDYCQYFLGVTEGKVNKFNNAMKIYNESGNWVLIPERDSTTITDWELYLNALYLRGVCNAPTLNCVVTVPAAQSATVTPAAVALTHPDTSQLNSSVFPTDANQAGAWITSDAGVATVDGAGLVTTVAAGVATITFTSTDGSFVDTSVITVS